MNDGWMMDRQGWMDDGWMTGWMRELPFLGDVPGQSPAPFWAPKIKPVHLKGETPGSVPPPVFL